MATNKRTLFHQHKETQYLLKPFVADLLLNLSNLTMLGSYDFYSSFALLTELTVIQKMLEEN
jgi:hypothetical protein